MLTPEQIELASDVLSPLFIDLENYVIADISRRLQENIAVTGTAEIQTVEAAQFGVNMDSIQQAFTQAFGITSTELPQILESAGILNILQESDRLEAGGYALKIEELPFLQEVVYEIIQQTQGSLVNLTQTTAVGFTVNTPTGSKFLNMMTYIHDSLDKATFKVKTGVQSPQQAIRQCVSQMADNGVMMQFESGYRCNIDVAVRRALRTGINQMSSMQNAYIADELGLPLAEVTAHQGARPDHKVWQGQVYQIVGRSKKYANLSEATGLGTVTGLLGANCRHSWHGFAEGMPRTYTQKELANIDPPDFTYNGKSYTHYEATQKQRSYERHIRAKKRELIGYDAISDKEAFDQASVELKGLKTSYKQFSNAADLKIRDDLMQVDKFGRSIAQKAVRT